MTLVLTVGVSDTAFGDVIQNHFEPGDNSNYYALVIGCGQYTEWNPLPNALKDAEQVSTTLRSLKFEKVDVRTNPTSAELKQALHGLLASGGHASRTRVLVYFAGHGYTLTDSDGTKSGYLVPVDAPRPDHDRQGFLAKAVNVETLMSITKGSTFAQILWVIDSCFGGAMIAPSGLQMAACTEELADEPVREILTSGTEIQEVPDDSVFRYCFIQGLMRGYADEDRDGCVTGREFHRYLQRNVEYITGGRQSPQFAKLSPPELCRKDFVFILPVFPPTAPPSSDNATSSRIVDAEEAKQWLRTHWIMVWVKAIRARELLIADRSAGETRFKELLDYYRNDGMVYYQRGLAYSVVMELDPALDDLQMAMFLMPGRPYQELIAQDATLLQTLKLLAENKAVGERKVRELISQTIRPYNKSRYAFLMGLTYRKQGEKEAAQQAFREALGSPDPTYAEVDGGVAKEELVARAADRMRWVRVAGEQDFQHLLAQFPADANIHLARADVYLDLKEPDLAKADVSKAESLGWRRKILQAIKALDED